METQDHRNCPKPSMYSDLSGAHPMVRSFVFPALLWSLVSTLGHAATIIHAGRMIDGASYELRTEASIVIDDGRFTRIAAG
jgi:hypothetical protein